MNNSIITNDITIIGAGLSGLTLAYLLKDSKYTIRIIEARNRLGGRILTKGYNSNKPIEMGATWLGNQHTQCIALLEKLELEVFNQKIGDQAIYEAISTSPPYLAKLPPNPQPSMRLRGGTEQMLQALAKKLNSNTIILNQPVVRLTEINDTIKIETPDHTFTSNIVVSTLPPNLLVSTIEMSPSLPQSFIDLAKATHTWMGESIKIALTYSEPFWRSNNLSGTIMSNVGPIGEMYDHSNYEESFFALKGFFSGNYFSITKEQRLAMVIRQLQKYYGHQAEKFLHYEEKVWRNEPYTFVTYNDHVLPHQNNGHDIFQNSFLNGKLIIGGTETSQRYPGYMEGAIHSAHTIAKKIILT